jgi:hypothetical protein
MGDTKQNHTGSDSVGELDKIRDRAEDKDVALLAQEMSFFIRSFNDYKNENTKRLDEINTNTKGNYAPVSTTNDHEKRIARLEKAALWVLGTTFALVFVAVVGLVITKGGQ